MGLSHGDISYLIKALKEFERCCSNSTHSRIYSFGKRLGESFVKRVNNSTHNVFGQFLL